MSEGSHSFNGSRSNRIQEISLEEANKKNRIIWNHCDKFEIKPLVEDTLNNTKPKLTRIKILKITKQTVNLLTVISKNFNHSIIKSGL